jgi:uncharacterized protein with NRDE domain
MCLILFAYNAHPRYRLVLAANRDEFYKRPTAPLKYWEDHPHILGGRDLEQLGTWMGITRNGRFAAITNYRSALTNRHNAPSRGHLVADFLIGHQPVADYLQKIRRGAKQYSGFNLIVGDIKGVHYYSNQNDRPVRLQPGIYGLSNHLLDTPWPKLSQGKQALSSLLREKERIDTDQLIEILQDQQVPADDQLPDTGIGLRLERILSPVFITSPDYGTRSSSILLIDQDGHVIYCERTWQPGQSLPVDGHTRCYEFKI